MSLVSSVTLTANAASIQWSNIPQSGKDLLLVINARTVATFSSGRMNYNGSTVNYASRKLWGDGQSGQVPSSGTGPTDAADIGFLSWNATANTFGNANIYISRYSQAVGHMHSVEVVTENSASNASFQTLVGGFHNVASPISTLSFRVDEGNLLAGTVASLYIIS